MDSLWKYMLCKWYACLRTCLCKQIAILHRNGLVCYSLPQETRRCIFCHMFLQRHIIQFLLCRILSKQCNKWISMRIFARTNDRISQNCCIRAVGYVLICFFRIFYILVMYTKTPTQMRSCRESADCNLIRSDMVFFCTGTDHPDGSWYVI